MSIRRLVRSRFLAPFRKPARLPAVRGTRLTAERLEDRTTPAPVPAITGLGSAATTLLGETTTFGFNVANTGDATGYSPFYMVAMDTTGPDGANASYPNGDGLQTPTFTVTGSVQPLLGTVIIAGSTYTNPFTGVTGNVPGFGTNGIGVGDRIFIYRLPFGSFTPGQTTAASLTVPMSNGADVGTALGVAMDAHFRDGTLPVGGTPIDGPDAATSITPELWRLNKVYLGPEDETATGANYKRRYRLDVDIATGQTVNALRIRDLLANSMQWTGAGQTTMRVYTAPNSTPGSGGTILPNDLTGTTAVTTTPGGEIVGNFGPRAGILGVDASLEFEFYVPRDRAGAAGAVLPQPPGTDSTTDQNTGSATGSWQPVDTRDPLVNPVTKAAPDNGPHTLQEHSVATQKSVTALDLGGNPVSGVRPGFTLLRYDIDFQVSDYYAVDDLFLEDLLGDGQRLYIAGGFGPTLTVNNPWQAGGTRAGTSTGGFVGGNTIDYSRQYTLSGVTDRTPSNGIEGYAEAGPSGGAFNLLAPGAIDGRTFLRFNISQELIARGLTGLLVGGDIPNGGGAPANGNPNAAFGAAQGRVTFYAVVKREFADDFPSTDRSVDQGDVLRNQVPLIRGRHLDTTTLAPTGTFGTDDTATSVSIAYGEREKRVYAVNGVVIPGAPTDTLNVQAGDRLTYLLTYTLPTSSFENLRFIDFPPLPVIPVAGAYTFNRDPNSAARFTAGNVTVFVSGADPLNDTYFDTFDSGLLGDRNPTVTPDVVTNSVTMNFGTHEDPNNLPTRITVLITFQLGDQAFASDLFLTNQLRISEGSTNNGDTTVEAIRRVEYVRPTVTVNKGVVGFNTTGRTLGGIAFTNPTVAPSFSGGPVFSAAQASAIGGANGTLADQIDAGDTVRFAIVAQNTGQGDAFDVEIRDQVQPGFIVPALVGALNLRVYRGDGTLLALGTDYLLTYDVGTGQFVVTLTDNYTAGNIGGAAEDARSGGLSRGAGDAGAITNGSNTVIVLYDLTLTNTVAPNQSIVNTAAVTRYGTSDLGPDLTDPAVVPGATDPTDTASVIVQLVRQAKTLIGTEVTEPGNNAANQAVIGELATYEVLFTLPEGVTPAAIVRDLLAEGLALTDILEVEFTSGLAATGYTAGGVLTDWQNNAAFLTANGLSVSGSNNRQINFSFGDIANNTNPNNAGNETIRIRYRVVVLNTNAAPRDNQAGATRNNSVRFEWTGFPGGMNRVAAGQTSNSSGVASGTPTPITIVEPTVTTDKQVRNVTTGVGFQDRVRADAGDTVHYRIVLSATGTTAFDVTLSDVLPTQLTGASIFSVGTTGTVRFGGTARGGLVSDFAIGGGTLTDNINIDMESGSTITIVVEGVWTGSAGNIVTNTAQARWTSLDGTPGNRAAAITGQSGVERTGDDGLLGGGSLNDYRTQDGADIESPTLVRKTIVSTSEITTTPLVSHPTAGGTADRTAIGELVRYRLYASVAEGLSRNFQLRDNLPAGLRFVNDGSARYVFVTTDAGALTSAANGGIAGLGGTTFLGDGSSLATLASGSISGTFAVSNVADSVGGAGTPTSPANLYTSGQDVFFRLGDLTNTDSDVDAEFVVIEFNVLVENITGNQAGVTRVNNFNTLIDTDNNGTPDVIDVVVDADGDGTGTGEPTVVGGTSNDATVTIVEPNVGIDKRAIATTGSVVTYRVTLTNTGANASAANDMVFTDLLPAADLNLILGSITIVGAGGATTGTADHDDPLNRVRFNGLFLPVGGTLTIEYQATVLSTPTGTGRITNTAGATFTSLTGANGFTTDFFGTLPGTLGGSGTATGERTGADGVGGALNDYAAQDPESLGSLGDRVYYDRDGDGVQDPGEPGLAGVTVTVRWAGPNGTFGDGDDSVISVNTDATGAWAVSGLPVGPGQNYRVSVPTTFLGMGLTDVRDNGGAANTDPDGLGAGVSAITLDGTTAATTNSVIQDFGFRDVGSLGDRVWHDMDSDGVQDAGEPGLPGVRVTVVWHGTDGALGGGDDLAVTATTDAAGNYSVGNLPAGNYTVSVNTADLPADFVQTFDLTGPLDHTANPTLTSGQTRTDVDFGYKGTATLGDRVWYDVDGDGVQDSVATDGFEPGIAGATVTLVFGGADGDLTTAADNVTYTTTTDAAGNYLFTGLFGGAGAGNNYRVTVTPPAAYPTNTGDPDSTFDSTTVTRLEANEDDRTQDFGYRGPNTQGLGNFVWEDLNGNGRQDGGEPGIVGVRVELLDFNGNVLDVTTTTAGGAYSFPNLAASAAFGDYRVRFTAPTGFVFTTRNATGTTAADDSNADTATGTSGLITLAAATIDDSIDAGLYRPVSIGNRVFFDHDGDGVQDAGEPGISGVPITVVWLGTDGVAGGVGDAADQTFTTTTGANGIWGVTNLPPGNYTVTVGTPPNGLTVLTDSLDNGGAPSAVNPVTVSTNSGVDRTDVDFGFRGTGSLGDRVWYDRDRDGVQDAGEEGFENVRVTVVWHGQDGVLGGGDDFTITATTGVNGIYTVGNLPLGEYTVTVNPADLPGNFAQSYDLDGLGTPHTARATLDNDFPSHADVDFGYTGTASIGDRVWLDQNRNGVQDPGEYGLPGAVVRLELAGADGQLGSADDLLYTATTGANGLYSFTDLPVYGPDDPFRVTVLSVPGPAGAIAAVSDLDSGVGTGDQVANGLLAANAQRTDVDFGYAGLGRISGTVFDDPNNDGVQQPGERGIPGTTLVLEGTDVFGNAIRDPLTGGPLTVTTDADGNYLFDHLPPGTYTVVEVQPTGFLDGIDTAGTLGGTAAQGNADDDRVRAIVLPAAGVSANNNFAEIRPASVSGSVYEDRNRNNTRDPFEPGIRGVRVVLTGTDDRGNPVTLTTTTDATGNYRFDGLRPGTYTLTETQPVGFAQSGNTVGSAGGALAPRDIIRTITLTPGTNAAGYLFGEVRQPDPVPALPVPPLDPTKREFLGSSNGNVLTVPTYTRLNSLSQINPVQFVAAADGPGGRYVRVFDVVNGQERFRFEPFPGFTGGMTAAVGDVTGDGIPDIVVGAGAGGGPAVVIYDGNTGQRVRSFFAFESIFRGGVFVTTGDFNNDGVEDVAVAAGAGGGPRVRVLSGGDPTAVLADFWGINDPAFRGGARVAAGDVNADGIADLVVAAGFGGGPRVSTYDGTQIAVGNPATLFGDFFAFEPTLTNGSYVTVGDIDGDGFADVIAGSGEGGAPRVTGFSGRELLAGRRTMVSNFFAFDTASTGGARVAAIDLDQDGQTELLVGSGPGHLPRARFFDPRTPTLLDEFASDWTAAASGVFVG